MDDATNTNRDEANMGNYNNAGSKFDRNLDIKDIATMLRKDIKAMQKSGLFSDMKVSVRIDRYSMGQALRVTITKWNGDIYNPDFVAENNWNSFTPRFVARAEKAIAVLRKLAGAWNYNNSDSMTDYFDVNYHVSVNFDTDLASADWNEKKAA